MFIVLYVDDLIITRSNESLIDEIKSDLSNAFDMSDLGLTHYCLGIEVWQKEDGVFLTQSKYARDLLYKFNMQDCKPLSTPMDVNMKLTAYDESEKVDVYLQTIGG